MIQETKLFSDLQKSEDLTLYPLIRFWKNVEVSTRFKLEFNRFPAERHD